MAEIWSECNHTKIIFPSGMNYMNNETDEYENAIPSVQ